MSRVEVVVSDLQKIFEDTRVPPEQTLADLRIVQGEVGSMIDALKDDGVEDM